MRCMFAGASVVSLLAVAGLVAQGTAPPPTFEVVSIRPSPDRGVMRHMRVSRGRLDCSNVTLKALVVGAYEMHWNHVKMPASMTEHSFNISATMPPGVSVEQIRAMLRAMLEDRFKLKVHREARTETGYTLVVAKGGPKLKREETTENTGASPEHGLELIPVPGSDGRPFITLKDPMTVHVAIHRATMLDLSKFLADSLKRTVYDGTGLTGKYDISLDATVTSETVAQSSSGPLPPPPQPPSFAVIPAISRLGLRLEATKMAVEYLVVDSAADTPTAN